MSSRSSHLDLIAMLILVAGSVVGLMMVWEMRFKPEPPAAKAPTKIVEKPTAPKTIPAPTSTTPTSPPRNERVTPAGMICNPENTVCINANYQNAPLTNPFSVTGTLFSSGEAGENLYWNLADSFWDFDAFVETSLVSGNSYTTGTKGWKTFTLRSFIPRTSISASATLMLSLRTDGGVYTDIPETAKLKLPVKLSTKSTIVTLHRLGLKDTAKKDGYTCPDAPLIALPTSQHKIMETRLPIEATLRMYTDLPSRGIKELSVRNGVATVVFEPGFWGALDACTQRIERASLEKTLQQFSTVQQVELVFTKE